MTTDSVRLSPSTTASAPELENNPNGKEHAGVFSGLSNRCSSPGLDANFEDLASASLAIARAFARGATMWALAPSMPAHAFHIAVEFVHPVIMGKRALPALALSSGSPLVEMRQFSKTGDIFVAIGAGDDPVLVEVMRRASVYGLTSLWIAAGTRPKFGSANHVIWLDENAEFAGYIGHLVMMYHLLWELTHVCFEHPGLLKEKPEVCEGPTCITCSDQGTVMEVVAHLGDLRVRARSSRGLEDVDISLVEELGIGELILVHGGSAISIVEDLS